MEKEELTLDQIETATIEQLICNRFFYQANQMLSLAKLMTYLIIEKKETLCKNITKKIELLNEMKYKASMVGDFNNFIIYRSDIEELQKDYSMLCGVATYLIQ